MGHGSIVVAVFLVLAAPTAAVNLGDDMAELIDPDKLGIATVAQEALQEPFEGKLAVAEVIHNRMKAKFFSDGTVAGTVLKPKQFSGWNTNDPVRIRSVKWDDAMPSIQECTKAWFDAKHGSNTANGALLYYNPTFILPDGSTIKTPDWALPENATEVARAGSHVFFVPKSKEDA
jgi:spore germination cell wall hydrolase CwlJ-like protein